MNIASRYKAGESLSKIASDLGCALQTVRNRLAAEGIELRGRGGQPKPPEEIEQLRVSIIELRSQGVTRRKIAEVLKTSSHRVKKVLDAVGDPSSRRGILTTSDGYILEGIPDDDPMISMSRGGYVLQHRLVMARFLNRPLTDKETVHHRDLNRANNEISNLQLRQGNHGVGGVLVCGSCGSHDIRPGDL